ncbi:MAG: hypothetical protein NVS1B3_04130 [Candidatus Dormibacteraceae bacterium]
MSEQDEDLELQSLQRQLDDAFGPTRPRAGFEDELWARMQARRPAGTRLREMWLGLIDGIRAAPAVPTAAVAALLVVVIGGGFLLNSLGGGSRSTATSGGTTSQYGPSTDRSTAHGAFGKLPAPALNPNPSPPEKMTSQPSAPGSNAAYAGPVTLTWAGKFELTSPNALVYRYHEPSTNAADQFATSLGAILQSRPSGLLGSYNTTAFNLQVRGTVQSPAREPWFTLFPISTLPSIDTFGGPADVAVVFLAEHSLVPAWPYTPAVVINADQSKVTLLRQFPVAGYGNAYLVDSSGEHYGLEVTLKGNTALTASGPLPLNTESATYPLIPGDEAVRSALASSPPAAAAAGAPTAALTDAELVYVLVVAGDHSFYEPAVLFSGKFTVNGTSYVKRVLVPAVDPSQRSS